MCMYRYICEYAHFWDKQNGEERWTPGWRLAVGRLPVVSSFPAARLLAETTPPTELRARRPPSRVRGCSRLRASSGSRHYSLGVLQLVICEHAASPHAPCAGRCSHFLIGECPLYTVAGHISSRSMAFCEPKPPPLVLHTTGATQVAVRCCSRCDLDAIPPPSCRGSD